MIKTNNYENTYANLVKECKEKLNRNLTDEELAFLKWLAQSQFK